MALIPRRELPQYLNDYLNVHIDAHEAIMSTYKKQAELDTMRRWLEKKESHGVLQTLEMKYNASYYDTLCKNENINAILKSESKDTMMQVKATFRIAIAALCDAKETRLKHLATVLGDVYECEEIAIGHGTATNEKFFIQILAKMDIRKPTDEGSIYAKSDYPVSQNIRAYLCIGLLNWLLNYVDQLLVEEETQFTQLILDLLGDAINETTLSYQDKIYELGQLEDQLSLLTLDDDVENDDDCKRIKKEIEKLKLDGNKFREERVCMPNPKIVFDKACLLANKLSDINRLLLLHSLDKLVKIKEIKLPELEESPSKKLENISREIDETILKQYKIEINSSISSHKS